MARKVPAIILQSSVGVTSNPGYQNAQFDTAPLGTGGLSVNDFYGPHINVDTSGVYLITGYVKFLEDLSGTGNYRGMQITATTEGTTYTLVRWQLPPYTGGGGNGVFCLPASATMPLQSGDTLTLQVGHDMRESGTSGPTTFAYIEESYLGATWIGKL